MLNLKKTLTKVMTAINKLTPSMTTEYGSSVTLYNNQTANLITKTIPPGKYILKGTVTFAANANGYRGLYISDTSPTQAGNGRFGQLELGNAGASNSVHMHIVEFVNLTNERTFYLNARQNSGGQLAANYPGLEIIKIG